MKASVISHPFVPKSALSLQAGHFWALPLSDGSFGCGRVIQTAPKGGPGSRVLFLAGVLDWHGDQPPTSESIAGAACIAQGKAHLDSIISVSAVLGMRGLERDNIEPWLFRGAHFHRNSQVKRGLVPVRAQLPTDDDLPVLSSWGLRVAAITAELKFCLPRSSA